MGSTSPRTPARGVLVATFAYPQFGPLLRRCCRLVSPVRRCWRPQNASNVTPGGGQQRRKRGDLGQPVPIISQSAAGQRSMTTSSPACRARSAASSSMTSDSRHTQHPHRSRSPVDHRTRPVRCARNNPRRRAFPTRRLLAPPWQNPGTPGTSLSLRMDGHDHCVPCDAGTPPRHGPPGPGWCSTR